MAFIKQYVRDHLILRTEPTTNNVTDYGVNKAIDHLPALRDKMAATIKNYLAGFGKSRPIGRDIGL